MTNQSANAAEQPATANTPTTARQGAIPRSTMTVLAVLVITAFVMMLNETTVSVALPSIMEDFAISATTGQWLLTGFMLTMAVVMPITGWMLERFTTRSVFIFATVIFLIGTIAAAVSPNFTVMLLARVGQALGTAVIMPLLMTVSMTLVPANRRGTVMGLIAVVMAVGPALGPTVAGVVLSFTNWHGIFWVMVPLVAVAAVIGGIKLTNIGTVRKAPFDVLSLVLSVLAFGGLVYGLSSIGIILAGGTDALIAIIVSAVGVVGLALFVWRQIVRGKEDKALLDLRPLGVRNFTFSLIVLMTLMGAMLGVMNTLPLYLQGSLLVSALVTGLVLLPGGLFEGVLSPFMGRIFDQYGPRPLIIPGMLVIVASLFWLATVDQNTSVWLIVAIHVIFSIGLAALITPLMTTALGSLPKNLYGHGSAILNTLQQLAGAAGTAVLIAVYSGVSAAAMAGGAAETAALGSGAGAAFLTAAILSIVAFVFALFIKRVPTGTETGTVKVDTK
ncbi:DHA2 family efflux MFS transporter permease subunit [Gulosibacter molinativorax]|uniref:MFS transporter n=1 Tax=Gulosibacter molinativorax TaxID=256821 RepID=A0ABT7C7T4_9MICO|nr:DHA2 family efflux MFS transporter permease subunit [Gulosibacter molinativorax]MDJ1370814.1 MFS transporter [Gulosibacter molinativorax]QUY62150.1 Lincomycin resistance protein LmrB [Gulosibacter molinativorax]